MKGPPPLSFFGKVEQSTKAPFWQHDWLTETLKGLIKKYMNIAEKEDLEDESEDDSQEGDSDSDSDSDKECERMPVS